MVIYLCNPLLMNNMLEIGIIGMSPGNAHPYSWSSIINGAFDAGEINSIGYPAVANYLKLTKTRSGYRVQK